MENCIFCNIIDNKDNIRNLKINKILYEDDLLMVIPAKGAPVVGWIMLIVKKAYKYILLRFYFKNLIFFSKNNLKII